MNVFKRIICYPSISDRYWWSWATAIMAAAMFIFAGISFYKHLWILGSFDVAVVVWNSISSWVYWGSYMALKEKQSPS